MAPINSAQILQVERRVLYRPSKKDQNEASRYQRDADDAYVFDVTSGLYTPKSYYEQKRSDKPKPGESKRFRFFTDPKRDLVATFVGIATLLVVGAYTYYAKQQWCEMVKATKATQKAARAASDNVKIASGSLQSVQDQFRLDQRAWVGPKTFALSPPQAPNPIRVTAIEDNTGKTPAVHVSARYYIHTSDVPIDVEEYAKHPTEKPAAGKATFTIFPNASTSFVPETGSTDALGVQNVLHGQKHLYVFIDVHYFDVFKQPHETRTCAMFDSRTQGFSTCPGNYDYAD